MGREGLNCVFIPAVLSRIFGHRATEGLWLVDGES
jgi:hypothetical protein